MSGLPSLLRDSHEPQWLTPVMETMEMTGLSSSMSPPKLAGKVRASCQVSILQPSPQGKELFLLESHRKMNSLDNDPPYPFLSKMDLHYPMHWAELWSLVAQHQWSEPGPHSSNVGIPTGGCPALSRRCMNKHTSTASILLYDLGEQTCLVSVCVVLYKKVKQHRGECNSHVHFHDEIQDFKESTCFHWGIYTHNNKSWRNTFFPTVGHFNEKYYSMIFRQQFLPPLFGFPGWKSRDKSKKKDVGPWR